MEMRFRSRLSINNHAVYFLLLLLVRSSACSVWVCVCGAVWSIRWNDDGRRGGGGAVYLFPLNSNLNDWWELIAWQWERDETRPLLPLNIVAGSPISGDPPLLSFTTLNHRVPPPPFPICFLLTLDLLSPEDLSRATKRRERGGLGASLRSTSVRNLIVSAVIQAAVPAGRSLSFQHIIVNDYSDQTPPIYKSS